MTLLSVPAAIAGTVYNDMGSVGSRQAGDTGVAGETVFLDLNGDHARDTTKTTVVATSTTISLAPGQVGAVGGGYASLLPVSGLPARISDLQVNMDLTNNGSDPVTVGVISPLGLTVPNLPTLFEIQPGEHFVGSFDASAATPVTLAARPLAPARSSPSSRSPTPPRTFTTATLTGPGAWSFLAIRLGWS